VSQILAWFENRGVSLTFLVLNTTCSQLINQFPSVYVALQKVHISTLQEGLIHYLAAHAAIASLEVLVVAQNAVEDESPLLVLLKTVPNLQKFVVHCDPMLADEVFLTDQTLLALAMHCPKLRCLQTDCGSMDLDDYVMAQFFSSCRFLESLRFQWDRVQNTTLELMGLHCAHLRKFDLSYNTTVTDEGLLALVKGCRQLVVLALNCCRGITSPGLAACGPYCTQLLEVSFELPQMDLTILPFFKHVNGLINISGCFSAEIVKQSSVHWAATRYINLSETDGTNGADEAIASVARECIMLRNLRLIENKCLTDGAMFALATHASQLESLEIISSEELITDDGLIALAEGCAKLELFFTTENRNLTYCSAVALTRRCEYNYVGSSLHKYDIYCAKLKVYNEQVTWYDNNSWRRIRKVKIV